MKAFQNLLLALLARSFCPYMAYGDNAVNIH